MTTKTKLPELMNRRRFLYLNAAPDNDYPLRILRAYLADAQTEWKIQRLPEKESLIYTAMNKAQAKRRKILEKAIEKLLK